MHIQAQIQIHLLSDNPTAHVTHQRSVQPGPAVKVGPTSTSHASSHTPTGSSAIRWRWRTEMGTIWHSPAAAATDSDTVTCTLDLAPVLDDENDGDVSNLTCKFLLAFSHCGFSFILNPCLPLGFMYLGCHSAFLCRHRLMQSHLIVP